MTSAQLLKGSRGKMVRGDGVRSRRCWWGTRFWGAPLRHPGAPSPRGTGNEANVTRQELGYRHGTSAASPVLLSRARAPLCTSRPACRDPKKKGKKKEKKKRKGNDTIPRPISRFLPPGRAWVCSKLPSPPLLLTALVKQGQETREQMRTSPLFSPKPHLSLCPFGILFVPFAPRHVCCSGCAGAWGGHGHGASVTLCPLLPCPSLSAVPPRSLFVLVPLSSKARTRVHPMS